eukprot:3692875-Heterocapsa_arctica.AAC.1
MLAHQRARASRWSTHCGGAKPVRKRVPEATDLTGACLHRPVGCSSPRIAMLYMVKAKPSDTTAKLTRILWLSGSTSRRQNLMS